jgi:SpoVK/Ycf46/Vps4 family AAA+-type ATPase
VELAKQNAETALRLDNAGKSKQAIAYYIKAADLLNQAWGAAKDPIMKKKYYETALTYIYRVKEIKQGSTKVPDGRKGEIAPDEGDSELRQQVAKEIVIEKPDVEWDDVADLEMAKSALKEAIIMPMSRPELFTGARRPWRGILMFGPPGCGKTFLAKAVASEVDATFFSISAASIVSRGEGENEAMRRVKTQLMQAIEGVGSGKHDRIVVMGATNLPWAIDGAMRRRFERKVYVTLPEFEARKEMFLIHTKGVEMEDVSFDELAQFTSGYSGADVALLCRDALLNPIRELAAEGRLQDKSANPRLVNRQDFIDALRNVKPSVAPNELEKYEEWNKQFGVS